MAVLGSAVMRFRVKRFSVQRFKGFGFSIAAGD
jgi:hypothetical protein